jgi:hypothetical protein
MAIYLRLAAQSGRVLRGDMKNTQGDGEPPETPETVEIAKRVLTIAGGTIAAISALTLGGAAMNGAKSFAATSQVLFNALLPLLGTWIGTVLAYYFSRKNFESASQSVERMVTLTVDQKLGSLAVDKEMLRPEQITVQRIPPGKTAREVPLSEIRTKLGGRITRMPIVDERGVVQYILHQSGLFKFMADKALAGGSNIAALTLQDLIEDAELKEWVTNIVYVPETATVAEAKKRMEDQRRCQDLIVTRSGNKDEPMRGWMTNVDIGRLSKA